MIATLAMYDRPETRHHWNIFWNAIRDALRARDLPAPDRLTRDGNLWDHWVNPDLILGQTCGLPYRTRLHGQVRLVGTLDHNHPDNPPGYYHSVLVTRRTAPADIARYRDATLAINARDSQSGWAAPQCHVNENGFYFKHLLETGAHLESARAVVEDRADIAGIDAETWRLIEEYAPEMTRHLTVIARTAPTPALPLITALRFPPGEVFAAVETGLAETPQATRDALHLRGIVAIREADYLSVSEPKIPPNL